MCNYNCYNSNKWYQSNLHCFNRWDIWNNLIRTLCFLLCAGHSFVFWLLLYHVYLIVNESTKSFVWYDLFFIHCHSLYGPALKFFFWLSFSLEHTAVAALTAFGPALSQHNFFFPSITVVLLLPHTRKVFVTFNWVPRPSRSTLWPWNRSFLAWVLWVLRKFWHFFWVMLPWNRFNLSFFF